MGSPSKQYFLGSVIACAIAISASADLKQNAEPALQLKESLLSLLRHNDLRDESIGLSVVDLHSGEALISHNSERSYSPASAVKMLTAYVVLKRLGVDYRFETSLRAKGTWDRRGVLHGDLYLVGSGDPTLSSEDLLNMAFALKKRGLKRITGSLIIDDQGVSLEGLDEARIPSDSVRPFNAPVSGINLDSNTFRIELDGRRAHRNVPEMRVIPATSYLRVKNSVQVTSIDSEHAISVLRRSSSGGGENYEVRGSLRKSFEGPAILTANVRSPQQYAGAVFMEILRDCGIRLKNSRVQFASLAAGAEVLTRHHSDRLSEIVSQMNKSSSNLIADSLIFTLGREIYGRRSDFERGLQVVNEEAMRLGINNNGFKFVSGSGLTRLNRMTPAQFTKLFHEAFLDFDVFPEWLSSMSIAGVDGTLEKRMKGNPAFGRLRGKTGNIDGVSTLVGVLRNKEGRMLAYSVLLNAEAAMVPRGRDWHDAFGRKLASFSWTPVAEPQPKESSPIESSVDQAVSEATIPSVPADAPAVQSR